MKKIVCFVMCMALFCRARADFWEIASSTPGEMCWGMIAGQYDNTGHDGVSYDKYAYDYYNIQCDMEEQYIVGPAKDFLKTSCGDHFYEEDIDGTCEVDSYRKIFCVAEADIGNMYVYDFPCDFCAGSTSLSFDWSSKNSNNAIVKTVVEFEDMYDSTYGLCKQNVTSERWGCPSGYYYVSGSGSSTVCAVCPSSAECKDNDGHTQGLRYKCIDGYFYNGTTCERCPSSGGVYGLTGKVGAGSKTECYIPSGGSFSDASGSGVFVGNCYYSE